MPNIFPLYAKPPHIVIFACFRKISILILMQPLRAVDIWFFFPPEVYHSLWLRKKRVHRSVNFSQRTRHGFLRQTQICLRGFLVCMKESGPWTFTLNDIVLFEMHPIAPTFQLRVWT